MTTEPIRVGIQDTTADADAYDPISILDELREELSTDVDIENLYLPVPNRENIRMVYRPVFDLDDIKRWRRAAREKPSKADSPIDQRKFFYLVLAETNIGLQIKSKKTSEWVDANDPNTGRPLTVKSAMVSDMLRCVAGWYATIEKMYSADGHIVVTAQAIMAAAGFDDFDFESGDESPLAD